MAGKFLDNDGLAWFKGKILAIVNSELAKKQNAGDYVTKTEVQSLGYLKAQNYGAARNQDSSKPTYGL